VAKVRTFQLKPDEPVTLRLDTLSDPQSLRLVKPNEIIQRGQGAGMVWAKINASGALKVIIATKDLGHAGEYGFAFSDTPWELKPDEHSHGWYTIDSPGKSFMPMPEMKIDAHWLRVEYNLD